MKKKRVRPKGVKNLKNRLFTIAELNVILEKTIEYQKKLYAIKKILQ